VAKDVCEVLGIANARDALQRLDDDEKGVATTDTLGGKQTLATVYESGLYALIFTSRKEEAKAFRKWVTSEVLPAIRKTGAYAVPGTLPVERVLEVADGLTRILSLGRKGLEERDAIMMKDFVRTRLAVDLLRRMPRFHSYPPVQFVPREQQFLPKRLLRRADLSLLAEPVQRHVRDPQVRTRLACRE
jgi:prophage antirepressor-like protein